MTDLSSVWGRRRSVRTGHRPGQKRREGARPRRPPPTRPSRTSPHSSTLKAERATFRCAWRCRTRRQAQARDVRPSRNCQLAGSRGGSHRAGLWSSTTAPAASCCPGQGKDDFEPREVTPAQRSDNCVEDHSGRARAAAGRCLPNFLIDAESNLGGRGWAWPCHAGHNIPAKGGYGGHRRQFRQGTRSTRRPLRGRPRLTAPSKHRPESRTLTLNHGPVASPQMGRRMTMEFPGDAMLAVRRPEACHRFLRVRERQPGEYVVTSITGASPPRPASPQLTPHAGHWTGTPSRQNHPMVRGNPFLSCSPHCSSSSAASTP